MLKICGQVPGLAIYNSGELKINRLNSQRASGIDAILHEQLNGKIVDMTLKDNGVTKYINLGLISQ